MWKCRLIYHKEGRGRGREKFDQANVCHLHVDSGKYECLLVQLGYMTLQQFGCTQFLHLGCIVSISGMHIAVATGVQACEKKSLFSY